MEKEPRYRDDERAILIALFRYGVIAPLAEQDDLEPGGVTALVRQIANQTHHLPGKGAVRVAERTVYAWLAAYRKGGLEALRPRRRSDHGTTRALDETILNRAIALRQEGKHRWTSTLIDLMRREGTLTDHVPHRATFDRHLARRGASRRLMRVLGEKRTVKLHFEHFGDLWVGDYHHGPLVLAPNGKPTVAKLGAFIDHATRYPVADRYYLAEDTTSLRDTLMRALLTWGAPKKAYVDNGAVYRADQLAYSLDRVGTRLIHSRPYYSQGRGVIERWWQIADQFEAEVRLRDELLTLHDLNALWEAYRDLRYCQAIHSEIGQTPVQAIEGLKPHPIDPDVARELFLVNADRQVGKRDATVSVEGQRFVCDAILRGRKVQVRYDPRDLTSVLILVDGKRFGRAFPQIPGEKPLPHPPEAPAPPPQSVDYLALLRRDFDAKLLEQARPLAYAQLEIDPRFTRDDFVRVVCDLSGCRPVPATDRELTAFWETYGPLPETLVRVGTEHAVRMHGRDRHPRIYLHAIRTLVLANLRSPARKDPP